LGELLVDEFLLSYLLGFDSVAILLSVVYDQRLAYGLVYELAYELISDTFVR